LEIHIPPTELRRWTGPYLGKYYGVLWKTHNIDLEKNEGTVMLSRRLTTVADTTDANLANLGIVDAFIRTDADCVDRWWALNRNGRLARTDTVNPLVLDTATWDEDTLASTPTDARDFDNFEKDTLGDTSRNQLFVTRDTDIAVLNDTGGRGWNLNWWVTTQSQTALEVGAPHPITYFPHRRIMLVGDGNYVHTISRPSDTANDTITARRLILPSYLQIQHIFTTTNRAWITCRHLYEGDGKVIEWDGSKETYNDIHTIYSPLPLGGVGFLEIPVILNNKGVLLEFDGRGFAPMVRSGQKIALPVSEEEANFFLRTTSMSRRGMTIDDDGLIYMNLDTPFNVSPRQTAGIWCLNPINGRLYNKFSIGQWGSTDFGQQRLGGGAGALFSLSTPNAATTTQRGFLVGGSHRNNSNASVNAIWIMENTTSSTAQRGYFITQFIPAEEIDETWDTLWVKFKRFVTAANRIIVKAQGVRSLVDTNGLPLEGTATWTSTTTFTVTLASGDDSLQVGDEIEVQTGSNSGYLAHITTISGAHAALQTITVDETVSTGSGTSIIRFDRWKKCATISDATVYRRFVNVGLESSFVRFKIELRGPSREMEIDEMVSVSHPLLLVK